VDRKTLRDDPDAFWKAWAEAGRNNSGLAVETNIPVRTIENWSIRHKASKPAEPEPDPDPISLEADRLRATQERRVQRVETREQARTEIILDHLTQALAGFSPKMLEVSPPKFEYGKKRSPMGLNVLLSDWQAGEIVDPLQVMGLNAYTIEVMARRVYHLERMVLTALDIVGRAHPIPKLYLHFLGDMSNGSIHDLAESNEVNDYEQVFVWVMLAAQFILRLAPSFEEIEINGVFGNHPRMHDRKRAKDRYVNWDWVGYQILELMLANQTNIVCNFPRGVFDVVDVEGHPCLLTHGDDIKSWQGIPWYGIQRSAARLTELLQAAQRVYEYFILAHFHQGAEQDRAVGEVIVNPSLVGGGEFSINGLFTTSPPRQRIFAMHREHGKTWELNNNLSKGDNTPHPYIIPRGASLAAAYRRLIA
jgi:hypothetical protein